MISFSYRPARRDDAADLAILDNVASYGMSLWYWQNMSETGETDALSLGRARFANNDASFGWCNALVAVDDDDCVLGCSTHYLMPGAQNDDYSRKAVIPAFAPVFDLYKYAEGDWFIDCLAVFSHARGNGIAAQLLDQSLEQGRISGAKQCSLVVEDDNQQALALYHSRKFVIREQRRFVPFNDTSSTKEWLLVTSRLI